MTTTQALQKRYDEIIDNSKIDGVDLIMMTQIICDARDEDPIRVVARIRVNARFSPGSVESVIADIVENSQSNRDKALRDLQHALILDEALRNMIDT